MEIAFISNEMCSTKNNGVRHEAKRLSAAEAMLNKP